MASDSKTQDLPPEKRPGGGGFAEAPFPRQIGRYLIDRVLGRGGFGIVYLARDEQLTRSVAVKVPHHHLVSVAQDAEAYLNEARNVARLDHPNIVPVYDVGFTEEFPVFVVAKYIDGVDLATRMRSGPLDALEIPALVAIVAEALHHAHRAGLVHRDVKPSNILLDGQNRPYVADFGLALREQDIGRGPRYAGTPPYMSPEQARGEGHRVDGRSDVFSLGIVLYELLTGHRPFVGRTEEELIENIVRHDPKPVRQWDDALPRELERICNTALAKRASERYSTARDFAEDLRHFLDSGKTRGLADSHPPSTTSRDAPPLAPCDAPLSDSPDSKPLRIVPKGLRSFDENDADFFVDLLPGPRDRDGVPSSLRFWKARIRETDAEKTFTVGLIYGPSGCGKSSLLKAGLLPRLSKSVLPIAIEATPQDTEARLLQSLRRRCPLLPEGLTLAESLAALRQNPALFSAKKLLVVIDQFEQWLHAHDDYAAAPLTEALRQCDGAHVQCIVLVRDDFWMAATRFLRELEVRQIEGENCAAVDLFPRKHARKVLAAFGRAFGDLPSGREMSSENEVFLDQAIDALAEQDKVICVRLSLFADMMKGQPWTPAALKQMGGAEGVGVSFLEGTFNSPSTPPERRWHQRAARNVLKALLPQAGSEIKGTMRSRKELLAASGYESKPREFEELLRILDTELLLITPTDPEGTPAAGDAPGERERRFYQLTHDYLIPSLRQWLTRKERETRHGRAQLLLSERTREWEASRMQGRYLLPLAEALHIGLFTASRTRTPRERQFLRCSLLHRGAQAAAAMLLVGALAAILYALIPPKPTQLDLLRAFADTDLPAVQREAALDALVLSDVFVFPRVIERLRESPDEAILAPTLARLEELSTSQSDGEKQNPVQRELLALCEELLRDPRASVQRPAFATYSRMAKPVAVCKAIRGIPLEGGDALLMEDIDRYIASLDLAQMADEERLDVLRNLLGAIKDERQSSLVASAVAKLDLPAPGVLVDWLTEAGVAGDIKTASEKLLVPYVSRTRAAGRVDAIGRIIEARLVKAADSSVIELNVPSEVEFLIQALGEVQPYATVGFDNGLQTVYELIKRRDQIGDHGLDTILLAFSRLNADKSFPTTDVREILANTKHQPTTRRASATCLARLRDVESVEPLVTIVYQRESLSVRTSAVNALGEIGLHLKRERVHAARREEIVMALASLIEQRGEQPESLVADAISNYLNAAENAEVEKVFPLLKEPAFSSTTIFGIHDFLRRAPEAADDVVTTYLRWKLAHPWDSLVTPESPDEILISLNLSAPPELNAPAEQAILVALVKAAALAVDQQERVAAANVLRLFPNRSTGPKVDPAVDESTRQMQWQNWQAWWKKQAKA